MIQETQCLFNAGLSAGAYSKPSFRISCQKLSQIRKASLEDPTEDITRMHVQHICNICCSWFPCH